MRGQPTRAPPRPAGCSMVLVGHVTKEGAWPDPRVLEHIVDTVLYFEGDTHPQPPAWVRAIKKPLRRRQRDRRLRDDRVQGPQGRHQPERDFLSTHGEPVPGSCVLVTLGGHARCWWRCRPWWTVAAPAQWRLSVEPGPRPPGHAAGGAAPPRRGGLVPTRTRVVNAGRRAHPGNGWR